MKRFCYRFADSVSANPKVKSKRAAALKNFLHVANSANRDAYKFQRACGADDYWSDPNFFAGGVAYLYFKKEPDSEIWRKAIEIPDAEKGQLPGYEPNARMVQMMARVPKGQQPHEEWNKVYKKRPYTFDEIKDVYSLQQWAQLGHYMLSGHDHKDWRKLKQIFRDNDFYNFVEIYPMSNIRTDKFGKEHPTIAQRKVVHLQKKRLSLPVVRTEELYRIMSADFNAVDDKGRKMRITVTPTFFFYEGFVYFCSELPCKGDDLMEISTEDYNSMREMAREAKKKKEKGKTE